MKYFFNLLLQINLSILSYFVKKDKMILFGCDRGYGFRGNTKFLYLYFNNEEKQQTEKYKYLWTTKDKKVLNLLQKKELPVVYAYSLKGFLAILRAKKLLVEVSSKDVSYVGTFLNGNFSVINTWHGAGFKQSSIFDHDYNKKNSFLFISFFYKIFEYFFKNDLHKTIFTASSSIIKKEYESFFPGAEVIITGFPRNDIFFKESNSCLFFNYANELNLKKYSLIILYAPTFRDFNSETIPFSKSFLKKLDAFLIANNYIFFIKKHNMEKNLEIDNIYSNIKDISRDILDIQELLPNIDVLISDYSSVVTDFSISHKPILFYIYDYENYQKKNRSLYFDIKDLTPGPFCYKEEELFNYLNNLDWFNESNYQENYLRFVDKFHYYQDGNSCKRVENLIEREEKI